MTSMDFQGQSLLDTNSTDENDKLLQDFFYYFKKVQFPGRYYTTSLQTYIEDVSLDGSKIWQMLFFLCSTLIF